MPKAHVEAMRGITVSDEIILGKILLVRGCKVMIDRDLAELYGVETKHLNRQVRRNQGRFPEEFMFKLTVAEKVELVTNWHRFNSLKHTSYSPYAFTEHGVAMLASVLKSSRAIKISVYVIQAFVRLRRWVSLHKGLSDKLEVLEGRVDNHDHDIQEVVEAMRQLMREEEKPKRKIGFHP